jgi:ferritin
MVINFARILSLPLYDQLQEIAAQLYTAAEVALQNNDFDDASLLQSRADKIYEEAENIDTLIIELEER